LEMPCAVLAGPDQILLGKEPPSGAFGTVKVIRCDLLCVLAGRAGHDPVAVRARADSGALAARAVQHLAFNRQFVDRMTVLAEYPLQALLFGVGQLEMGMELYIALAIRALLHLDPKMMENITYNTIDHCPMQRCSELGDFIANLIDFRVVILHLRGSQFKSSNKGRDWVYIKTNNPGVATHRLHQTCPATDEGIENNSSMQGGLAEIGIPKCIGLIWWKGQRSEDRAKLRADSTSKPAVDPVQRI